MGWQTKDVDQQGNHITLRIDTRASWLLYTKG